MAVYQSSRELSVSSLLSVLVTGRSGIGKSTIINGLLWMTMEDDKHIKETAAIARPGNLSLTLYTKKKGKINVTVCLGECSCRARVSKT